MDTLFKVGDEVAILPRMDSPASDVLEIATVAFATSVYVQLADRRMFTTIGGKSLCAGTRQATYIVPAAEQHRAAMHMKFAAKGA